ncbi:MAG: hypothetical protein R3F11_29215 [Verrucomicrobiales bacterium]
MQAVESVLNDLRLALASADGERAAEFLSGLHEADVAELYQELDDEPAQRTELLRHLSDETKAEMVEYLPLPVAEEVLDALPAVIGQRHRPRPK